MILGLTQRDFGSYPLRDGGLQLQRGLSALLPAERQVWLAVELLDPIGRVLRGRAVAKVKNLSDVASRLYVPVYYRFLHRRLLERIRATVGRQAVTAVWASSNSNVPMLGATVAREIGCPLHVSIFDLPFTYSVSELENRYLHEAMPRWFAQATSADYASSGMAEWVGRSYPGARASTVLWSSAGVTPESVRARPPGRVTVRDIAFCGSSRFGREMLAFADALALLGAPDRQLIAFSSKAPRHPRIRRAGYLDHQGQLMDQLAQCDAAYSPFPFAPEDELLARTSFPGKVTTYLMAGLPIVAHGPAYASNVRFVERHQLGLALSSLEPQAIAEAIRRLDGSLKARECAVERARGVVSTHFSPGERASFYRQALLGA